jgi:hypothetical protein
VENASALVVLCVGFALPALVDEARAAEPAPPLAIRWAKEHLTVSGPSVPGGSIDIHYLEAFCRAGSSDRDWSQTVIPHKTERTGASDDGRRLQLRSTLADGVVVTHELTAAADEIDFRLVAKNPTKVASQAVWAQPCVRVDRFTGRKQDDYLDKCFIFLDGRLTRLPTRPWATKARYTPGQVWRPRGIGAGDVNPRPLSELTPSNGLIGCFSADGKMILASAWEPYQELFQGVITCVHSDFRIGGLAPGETKHIRGKLYLLPADADALLKRYERDFPERGGK